jgi:hypothetical protein
MTRFRIQYKNRSIGASDLKPFRKSIALTLVEGNTERVLAYFRNEECAKVFNDFISQLPLTFLEDNDQVEFQEGSEE